MGRAIGPAGGAVAALNHAHICTLYDLGHDAGMHYLVFEYLAGEILSDRLSKGPLPLKKALQYAIQTAEAIRAAIRKASFIVTKPHNIMLMQFGLKLLDFLFAELRYSDQQWMARPKQRFRRRIARNSGVHVAEQIEGGETDVRNDIFGFGLVTYQMVTGRPAFRGADHAALPRPSFMTIPLPLRQLAAHIPPALDFLLERCLVKCPRTMAIDRRRFIDAAMDCSDAYLATPRHASRMTTAQETN